MESKMTFIELVEKFNSGIGDLAKEQELENFLTSDEEKEKNYLFWWFNYTNLGIKFRKIQKYLEKTATKQLSLFHHTTKEGAYQISDFPVLAEMYKTRTMSEADFLTTLAKLIKESSDSDSQALMKIIIHPPIGIGLQTMNKIWNKLYGKDYFTPFGIMKACKFNEDKFKEVMICHSDESCNNIVMEEKYDGIRCIISVDYDEIKLRTSNGNEFKFIPSLVLEELKFLRTYIEETTGARQFCFDSELVSKNINHTESRQRIAGIGNKLLKNSSLDIVDSRYFEENAEFRCFACFLGHSEPTDNIHTLQRLRDNVDAILNNEIHTWQWFKPAELTVLTGKDYKEKLFNLKTTFMDYISRGREGIIVKDMSKLYELKRSWSWMKLKEEKTADCIITGCFEGNGAKSGMLGGFNIELNQDGKHIIASVGSGFSDLERTVIWQNKDSYIGKIVEIKYNDLIKSANSDTYSFFLPIFKRIRDDKNETNLD